MSHGKMISKTTFFIFIGVIFCLFCPELSFASSGEVLLVQNNPAKQNASVNIKQLSTFLSNELKEYDLQTVPIEYPEDKADNISLTGYFGENPPEASVLAIVWIDSGTNEKAETEFIAINVFFPSQQINILREIRIVNGNTPKDAVLAAIIAGMISREQPKYETKSGKRRLNLKIHPAPKQAESEKEKFELDLLASYLLFPKTTINMFGLIGQLSYFPKAPLAVILGSGYYQAVNICTNRYRLSYKLWPISAGGRLIMENGNHEISMDLQMLADISKFTFHDLTGTVDDNVTTRINVGLTFGTSWNWYPTRIIGLSVKTAVAFTPRTQNFIVEENDIFTPGSFSARISFGLSFDFSR